MPTNYILFGLIHISFEHPMYIHFSSVFLYNSVLFFKKLNAYPFSLYTLRLYQYTSNRHTIRAIDNALHASKILRYEVNCKYMYIQEVPFIICTYK